MQLEYIIDYAQAALDDAGVHYTTSGVSSAINEGNEIMAITTLYYERTSSDWAPTLSSTGTMFVELPSDCIVPLFVRDTVTRSRISPVKISQLQLEDRTWWRTYATSAEGYKYYSIWNPRRPITSATSGVSRFSLIMYPQVQSATNQISMTYAAIPQTLTSTTDHSKIPEGADLSLGDWAVFCGLMRSGGDVKLAMKYLENFFNSARNVNITMRSRYPNGRDFEPQPIEQLLERSKIAFEGVNDRNRTSSRNR